MKKDAQYSGYGPKEGTTEQQSPPRRSAHEGQYKGAQGNSEHSTIAPNTAAYASAPTASSGHYSSQAKSFSVEFDKFGNEIPGGGEKHAGADGYEYGGELDDPEYSGEHYAHTSGPANRTAKFRP